MRLFFALRLAEEVHQRLAAVAERLQAWDLPARWVHPDDYHLTVLFLGDVPEHEAGYLEYAVHDVAASLLLPELQLPGLGAFAGKQAPRIVYAAVADRVDWCGELHRNLADVLSHDLEPHFKPHITLCRPDQQRLVNPGRWWQLFEAHGQADWGSCPVTDLVLYRSLAGSRGGRRYEAMREWPLG
jgi:RNA 2',3'-cyclic 3'-phosphodiesterase